MRRGGCPPVLFRAVAVVGLFFFGRGGDGGSWSESDSRSKALRFPDVEGPPPTEILAIDQCQRNVGI